MKCHTTLEMRFSEPCGSSNFYTQTMDEHARMEYMGSFEAPFPECSPLWCGGIRLESLLCAAIATRKIVFNKHRSGYVGNHQGKIFSRHTEKTCPESC